jgi:hypothetical protein
VQREEKARLKLIRQFLFLGCALIVGLLGKCLLQALVIYVTVISNDICLG